MTDETEKASQFFLRHFNENEKINSATIHFLFLSDVKFESTFKLLTKLFDENIIQNFVKDENSLLHCFFQNPLSILTPQNAIKLINSILNNILNNKNYSVDKILSYKFNNNDLSIFNEISENYFENFIERIFPLIEKISNLNNAQDNQQDCWINLYEINEDNRFNYLIISTLITSLYNLSRTELNKFEEFENTMQNSNYIPAKYILLSVYAKNKELSENALNYLFTLKKSEINLLNREIFELIENMDANILLKEIKKFKEFGKSNFLSADYEIYEYFLYKSISEITHEYDEKIKYLEKKYPDKPQKEKNHTYSYNSVTEDVSKFSDEQWMAYMK